MSAASAAALLPAVADVGGQVFTRAPWREPLFQARSVAARLHADLARPGFVLAVACVADELVGFGYGHRCSSLAVAADLPCGEDFTLKELGVLPAHWGKGVGAALHDRVLTASGAGPCWLVTDPRATAAIGLYRRRGWQAVARHPAGGPRLIMRRAIHGARPAQAVFAMR
ncbi:GNAT family N-acetyltransferase [Acrocarpospora macrocephala]|uniref:GNAT family N-acetyltransferase n=1 Tax=Acrocarpospora macrocephala TaxID=150177 RepID=UPI001478C572|nr:GNAT family N-acetyltransferase [Acrocarpospora macrocephala]